MKADAPKLKTVAEKEAHAEKIEKLEAKVAAT